MSSGQIHLDAIKLAHSTLNKETGSTSLRIDIRAANTSQE